MGSNHRYARNGYGSWNTAKKRPYPRVVENLRTLGIKTMRFPGGSVSNMYDWKGAIGPPSERQCQIDARWDRNGSTGEFGIDEHMKLARMVGSETMVTVPFATSTPGDAADLVEYMNARVGEDPNGDGVDWALKRLRNQRRLGEPIGPYNIKQWSVGNEPYLANQRYWMSEHYDIAQKQYLHGGRAKFENQLVGRKCSRSEATSEGTGKGTQRFRVLYPPVKPGSQRITVAGRAWTEVKKLTPKTADKKVYTINHKSGQIRFGDRTTGARPGNGRAVRASYTSVHKGYLAYARAMHAADPRADVCSEWGHPSFVQLAKRHDYDCLAAHSYSFMHNYRWRSARDGHDVQMLAEASRIKPIWDLKRILRSARGTPCLLVSEAGHLSNMVQPRFPRWESSVSDGLYMTTLLSRFVKAGMPLVVGGAVIAGGARGWLGGKPDFDLAAPAKFLQMMKPMLAGSVVRGNLVRSPMRNAEHVQGQYPALYSLVTRKDGALNILLINRDPKSDIKVKVNNRYRRYLREAGVWRISSDSFTDTSVRILSRTRKLGSTKSFTVNVGAHSMIRLRLRPRAR